MDGPRTKTARHPWWPLLLVVVFALGVRVWTVSRSEVAARDSIGFIKYALRYESEPFVKVLREAQQPPAYPLAILATSWPVRAIVGETTPQAMAISAQIASAFFGVLLVLPMVAFGAELMNRQFGLVAAAMFQCLPAWVRFTSDGLSESTFLFFIAMALWLSARAFRMRSNWSMASCGIMAGFAFLTRPEGAEIVVAVAVVLVGLAAIGQWERRPTAIALTALVAGFLVCFGPFFAATGKFTNKPTARTLMGDPTPGTDYFGITKTGPAMLAVWYQDSGHPGRNKFVWSVQALAVEVASSSRQIGLVLSIVGLFFWQKRVRSRAGGVVMMMLAAMHAVLLIRMSSQIGYLSERHTALIVLTGCYPATLALIEIITRLMRFRGRQPWFSEGTVFTSVVALFFLSACPSLAKSMHANRCGHRVVGEWLARNVPAAAAIRDPFCWAQYYSGRDFRETAAADPDEQFVIVDLSDGQHSRLPLIPEVKAKAAAGEMVFHWPENLPTAKAQIAVYRWLRPIVSNANRPSSPAAGDASDRIAAASP
jgi:Dolichyl-phosphate-mannose-protein mannosyltransferase